MSTVVVLRYRMPQLCLISHDRYCSVLFTMHHPVSVAMSLTVFLLSSRLEMNGTAAEKPEVFSVKWISRAMEHPALGSELIMISLLV